MIGPADRILGRAVGGMTKAIFDQGGQLLSPPLQDAVTAATGEARPEGAAGAGPGPRRLAGCRIRHRHRGDQPPAPRTWRSAASQVAGTVNAPVTGQRGRLRQAAHAHLVALSTDRRDHVGAEQQRPGAGGMTQMRRCFGFPFAVDAQPAPSRRARTTTPSCGRRSSRCCSPRRASGCNQPEFGCGLFNLVFEPDNTVLAAAAEFTVGAGADPVARRGARGRRGGRRPPTDELITVEVAYTAPRRPGPQAVRVQFSLRGCAMAELGRPTAGRSSTTRPATTTACCARCASGSRASCRSGRDFASEADFGNVLLELFAHMGDILSYYQDRVAERELPGHRRRPGAASSSTCG